MRFLHNDGYVDEMLSAAYSLYLHEKHVSIHHFTCKLQLVTLILANEAELCILLFSRK